MPNEMINALLGQQAEVPSGPSPFGIEPPRPEDTISNLYRSKPAWLQSGMMQAPTGSFPETGRERRSRKSGEFDASAKDFLSKPANVLSLGGPALIPAAMAMESSPNEGPLKKQESLPVGGTKTKTGQTVAGFPEPRPTLSREDQAKLNVMNTEIEKHNATIARHAALKEDKPALYASRTAGALAALQRLTKEASAIEGPHRANTEAWQERSNNYMAEQNKALFQQQQKEAAANERFQTRNPGWGDAAPKYGAGLAGVLGGLAGLTGKGAFWKPVAHGFGLGALEGAGASAAPNLADIGALPLGSENWWTALKEMGTPEFGAKVAAESGLHGIAGALGASAASNVPRLISSGASSIKAIAKWLKNPTGAKAPSVPKAKAAPAPPPPVVTQSPPMATQPPPILPEAVKRPRRESSKLPPVPIDHVRFFHSGADPTSGGGRWVNESQKYVTGYREGQPTHHVDIPNSWLDKKFPDTELYRPTDGVARAPYPSFEVPEKFAQQMKLVSTPVKRISKKKTTE